MLDSGESAGQLWFTMPFVEGEILRDRLAREGQLPIADAVRLTREAARALDLPQFCYAICASRFASAAGPLWARFSF